MPKLSNGTIDDIVRVPNIPLMAAITEYNSGRLSFGELSFLSGLFVTSLDQFHSKTVEEYLFGYTDGFTMAVLKGNTAKAGLMSSRRGVATDNLTIYTGEDSLDNLGKIYAMNGQTVLNTWKDECNEIVGTDGSQFPPYLMDMEQDLKIFIKSFCRPLTLQYEREVSVMNGIPAWRYKTAENEFASSRKNPAFKCYCDAEKQKCPPDGVFDASKCLDGIPLHVSYPHFLEGDASLLEHFEGLNPNVKDHETFADIHARMAFPISGASRLQMNFKVSKYSSFIRSYYKKLPDDLILPIFWFEVTAGEIPAEFQKLVFHTTQSANATYLAIQYGSLVGAIVSLLLLISTSYIYFIKLTKKPAEKVQNKDVVVTFTPTAPTIENGQEVKLYPNKSTQIDQNKS
jgi:scavenger receptor class B, member 1